MATPPMDALEFVPLLKQTFSAMRDHHAVIWFKGMADYDAFIKAVFGESPEDAKIYKIMNIEIRWGE